MRVLVCLLVLSAATPLVARPEAPAAPKESAKAAEVPKAAEAKPVEVIPGLPDFPNAVMASYEEKGPGDGWTKTWKRETKVAAPYQDVRKFYLEQIEKNGWRVSSTKEKPDEIEWSLTRGASWAEIELDAELGMVKVSVERKDR